MQLKCMPGEILGDTDPQGYTAIAAVIGSYEVAFFTGVAKSSARQHPELLPALRACRLHCGETARKQRGG